MNASAAWLAAELSARRPRRGARPRARLRGDLGEGVISVAIAVLIMAFLGAAMWAGFNTMWKQTETNVCAEIGKIGTGGKGC